MLNIEIDVGGAKVLSSGSVITTDFKPIRLWLFGRQSSYYLDLRIDPKRSGTAVNGDLESTGFVITMPDVTEGLSFSTTIPFYVANYDQRKLLMNFLIFRTGETPPTRLISYTIFDGGPANG